MYPKNTLNEAYISSEKIRKLIEMSQIIENRTITISIGLTIVNESDNEDSIFKRVDDLMYYSKNHGKNRTTTHIN